MEKSTNKVQSKIIWIRKKKKKILNTTDISNVLLRKYSLTFTLTKLIT